MGDRAGGAGLRPREEVSTSTASAIDLNADLGEGAGKSRLAEDQALLSLVSSANIACGYHAGDATTIRDTVRAAHDRGVVIGAHPSFPDRINFGRRDMEIAEEELDRHIRRQIEILSDACIAAGAKLSYVKPHGALYNRAVRDPATARLIAGSVSAMDRSLVLLGLAGSGMLTAASDAGLPFAAEAFADRGYLDDGSLVPRGEPGALLDDPAAISARALRMIVEGKVRSRDGKDLSIKPDSLCTHGDGPNAATILGRLRTALEAAGVKIAPFVR